MLGQGQLLRLRSELVLVVGQWSPAHTSPHPLAEAVLVSAGLPGKPRDVVVDFHLLRIVDQLSDEPVRLPIDSQSYLLMHWFCAV